MSFVPGRSVVDCLVQVLLLSSVLIATTSPASAGILDATWTAPTTNTDGSRLTDLASYRLYYSSGAAPCPGSAFISVASPTLSPAPNQTVSLRLSGLVTGTTYSVAVTAIDTSGNESACSAAASAAARASFDVSPSGAVNFGSVSLGSSADRTFTVSNTSAGTLSGTAAVTLPFTVVSGSPFTLSAGATQAVTVRFTPATTTTVSATVSFVASGETVSRVVTGAGTTGGSGGGTGSDTVRPSIAITVPTSGGAYTTSSASVTLQGTASDNVGVTRVSWTNSSGGAGTATGTTSWTASGIALQPGSNVLTVTAFDAAGNTGAATLTVTFDNQTGGPGTPTPVSFSDVFARPDSSDLGPNYDPQASNPLRIVGQRVRSPLLASGQEESVNAIAPGNDQCARITLGTFTGAQYGDAGPIIRAAAPGTRTFYGALVYKNDPNYTSAIYMRINGAVAFLATESATTWASGNVVELCGVGPNLTLKRNGVTVLTTIDSNITGGRIGLRIREDGNLQNLDISAFSGGDAIP
jgi:hypothetical protein